MVNSDVPEHLTRVWKAAHEAANPWGQPRTIALFVTTILVSVAAFLLMTWTRLNLDILRGLLPAILAGLLFAIVLQLSRAQELIRHLTDPPQDD